MDIVQNGEEKERERERERWRRARESACERGCRERVLIGVSEKLEGE